MYNPKIVTAINIVKDKQIDTIIEVVIVNEYGTLPHKFAIKIKKNKEYINGKYNSFPSCSLTIEPMLAYILSKAIDHFDGTNLLSLLAK